MTESEIMAILAEKPTATGAAKVAEYIFPGLYNLTISMQGMVIYSLINEEEAYFFSKGEYVSIPVWDHETILKPNREIHRRDSYEETLAYAKELLEMHKNWGLEK